MIEISNVAAADQLHANGRAGFNHITNMAKALRAEGYDDSAIAARLVAEVGVPLVSKLGGDDDHAFWDGLWNLMGALAFAATEVKDDA